MSTNITFNKINKIIDIKQTFTQPISHTLSLKQFFVVYQFHIHSCHLLKKHNKIIFKLFEPNKTHSNLL